MRKCVARMIAAVAVVPLVIGGSPCVGAAPRADSEGVCGAVHMVAVNSLKDSSARVRGDKDHGFFARAITGPVWEKTGQPASVDASAGVAPEMEEVWRNELWSQPPASQVASEDASPVSSAPPSEDDELALTRTYINLDALPAGGVDEEAAMYRTTEVIDEVARRCPETRIALVGYAEGAVVASRVASAIGAGSGPVEAGRVAAVALFSDPSRGVGQPVVASGASAPEGMATPGAGEPSVASQAEESGTPLNGVTAPQSSSAAPEDDKDLSAVALDEPTAATDAETAAEMPDTDTVADGDAEALVDTSVGHQPDDEVGAVRDISIGTTPGGGIVGGGIPDFGDLAARTVSWCVSGDLVCGMPEGSPVRTLVDAVVPKLNTDDPQVALMQVADTLGPAVMLGGVESVAESISFGPNGFEVSRADDPSETLIGRIALEAQRGGPRDVGEMGERVVAASAKIAGMGLAAGITMAREVLTPENIAQVAAAGAVDPAAGVVSAVGIFADAALELVSPQTAVGAAGRVFDEVDALGLNEETVASVAMDVVTWRELASSPSYETVPVVADGRSATQVTSEWITQLTGHDPTPGGSPAAQFDGASVGHVMDEIRL